MCPASVDSCPSWGAVPPCGTRSSLLGCCRRSAWLFHRLRIVRGRNGTCAAPGPEVAPATPRTRRASGRNRRIRGFSYVAVWALREWCTSVKLPFNAGERRARSDSTEVTSPLRTRASKDSSVSNPCACSAESDLTTVLNLRVRHPATASSETQTAKALARTGEDGLRGKTKHRLNRRDPLIRNTPNDVRGEG
jgi:hypothetical protein